MRKVKTIAVSLPAPLVELVKDGARAEGRSVSGYVASMLWAGFVQRGVSFTGADNVRDHVSLSSLSLEQREYLRRIFNGEEVPTCPEE